MERMVFGTSKVSRAPILDIAESRRGRHAFGRSNGASEGVAIVEFAIVSIVFLMIVFGTIDFGRAIYLKSQLTEATRDAAREVRARTANGNACGDTIQSALNNRVRNWKSGDDNGGCNPAENPRPGLGSTTVTYSCSPSCASGGRLTVTAQLPFAAFTQQFLGISPITLRSTASVTLE
jgi:Flp pilus assembly protein TadG